MHRDGARNSRLDRRSCHHSRERNKIFNIQIEARCVGDVGSGTHGTVDSELTLQQYYLQVLYEYSDDFFFLINSVDRWTYFSRKRSYPASCSMLRLLLYCTCTVRTICLGTYRAALPTRYTNTSTAFEAIFRRVRYIIISRRLASEVTEHQSFVLKCKCPHTKTIFEYPTLARGTHAPLAMPEHLLHAQT